MKKNLFSVLTAFMIIAASVLFSGCSDDDDNNNSGENSGKAKIVMSIDMEPNASMGYIVPVKDINVKTASYSNAQETYTCPYITSYGNWIFYVPGSANGTITKYTRQEDGTLSVDGGLTIAATTAMCVCVTVASETKAYASAPLDNKIIIFNPATMEKTGEINLNDTKWGLNGTSTPNPLGMIIREGKLYVGCGEFTQMPITAPGAYMMIIDTETDNPEKIFSDPRLSSASMFNGGMFIDENDDIYVTCWGSYGYSNGQKFGLLRIKNGETEFDSNYCFNMSDMTFDNIEGGYFQYSITNYYAGNGNLYVIAYCPGYAGESPDYINDKTNICLKANLYNCTMEPLAFPRTNGYSCAISQYGDDILFGLTTESNGTGIFSYNQKTGKCSSSPIINAQGTIMNICTFDN